ncbi:MAG: UbiA family prenyltransferase [Thermoplasmata archaeon]
MQKAKRTTEPLIFKIVPKFEPGEKRLDSYKYTFDAPERLEQIPWDISPYELERQKRLKEEKENYAFPEQIEVLIRKFEKYMDSNPKRRAVLAHLRLGNVLQLFWFDFILLLTFFAVITNRLPSFEYIPFVVAAMFMSAAISTITEIGNIEKAKKYDEDTKRKKPLVSGILSLKSAWIQVCILFFLSLAISFAFLGPVIVGLFILLMVLSTQYAFPPLKMNSRPIFSQLFLVINAIVFYLCVASQIGLEYLSYGSYFAGAIILYHTLGESLAQETLEIKNALSADENTTAIYFGAPNTIIASFVFMLSGLALWSFSVFVLYYTNLIFSLAIVIYSILWGFFSFYLMDKIHEKWSKGNAKKFLYYMRISFFVICILTILAFVTYVPEPVYIPKFNS